MAVDDEIWRPGYTGPEPVSGAISLDRPTSGVDVARVAGRRPRRLVAAGVALVALVVTAVVIVGSRVPGVDPGSEVRRTEAVDAAEVVAGDVTAEVTADEVTAEFTDDVVDDHSWDPTGAEPTDLTEIEPLELPDPAAASGGTGSQRIPTDVIPRWTTAIGPLVADGGTNSQTWVEVVDGRSVVVGAGDARRLDGPAAVFVLDASTGARRWTAQVDIRIDRVELVTAIDDVLVLTAGGEIVAFDLDNGSQRWSIGLTEVDGARQQVAHLAGTSLLGVSGPDAEAPIVLLDATTGAVVGELIGEVVGNDGLGRWYVLRGGKLLEFDLGRNAGGDAPDDAPIEIGSELVALVDSEPIRPKAVVAGSLVTTVDGRLALGSLTVDGGERVTGSGGFTALSTAFGTPDGLVSSGFEPLGGSAFAIVGGGMVRGAQVLGSTAQGSTVLGSTVRFAWRRRGSITAVFPTERGTVLVVGSDGGAVQTVVDGATGETITESTTSPGRPDVPDVVGNGIVTRLVSEDATRIAGLDLDGNELWTLDGATPVSIGDGIVVRSTPQTDGTFDVTAYGESG